MSSSLEKQTILALRRQNAVLETEVENKNERIQNLLKEIQNLRDQLAFLDGDADATTSMHRW